MASADFSWLPSGTTEVKVGRTLTDAAKARRGEKNGLSKVPREFYTVHYKDMPISVDEHGSGSVEYMPNGTGGQSTLTVDRGSVGTDDIQVFAGAEAGATDEQCVLIFDVESGEVFLEKVDSMFRLALAKKNYAPLRTSRPIPQSSSSSKDKDHAPSKKQPPKPTAGPDEEEEGEISEDEPLVKTRPPTASRTAQPKTTLAVPPKSVAPESSKAATSVPSIAAAPAPSKPAAPTLPKPKTAAGQKSGPPKPRPVVKKPTPPPEPKPAPINLPGGAWKDASGAVLDRDAPAPPKQLRLSPPPAVGPSRALARPPAPSAPSIPRAAPAAPSVPMPFTTASVKPISTASAASSDDLDDMEEVEPGATNAAASAPTPSFPPPPRFLGTLEIVDDAETLMATDPTYPPDLFSPAEATPTGDDDYDFLGGAMRDDDDDMEEVAPEEEATADDMEEVAPEGETAADEDADEDFLAELVGDEDNYTQPNVDDSESDSDEEE